MNPLEQAADLIEERGWCRGQFRDSDGRICLDFALITADLAQNARARVCVVDELAARGVSCDDPVLWNDFHARGETEVIDLLRHAAKRWSEPMLAGTRREVAGVSS